jgi:hypothetical protein
VLQPVGDAIWLVPGPTVQFLRIPYPTRMVVVRLASGGLWIWSPIALDETLQQEIDAIGPVRHLVTPNKIHHLFLQDWARAYPQAHLWAPPGLAGRRADLRFSGELRDEPEADWAADIDQVVVRGSFFMEEVLFFHRPSRTCLVGDLVQKHDTAGLSFWQAALMRLDGLVGERGSTPREWRATFLRRSTARAAIRRALDWSPLHLIIAHGTLPRDDGAKVLRESLAWLRP